MDSRIMSKDFTGTLHAKCSNPTLGETCEYKCIDGRTGEMCPSLYFIFDLDAIAGWKSQSGTKTKGDGNE